MNLGTELLSLLKPPPASFFRTVGDAGPQTASNPLNSAQTKAKQDAINAGILAAIEKLGRPASGDEINMARETNYIMQGASLRYLTQQGIICRRQFKNELTGKHVLHYGKAEWFPSKKEAAIQTQQAKSDKVRARNHEALRRIGHPAKLCEFARACGVSDGSLLNVLRKDPGLTRVYSIDDPDKHHPLWWFKGETP